MLKALLKSQLSRYLDTPAKVVEALEAVQEYCHERVGADPPPSPDRAAWGRLGAALDLVIADIRQAINQS